MKKEEKFKSGYAAIVGKPNVGKSTLLNRLVMKKIAAISNKPQTTRNKITGVVHFPGGQIILLDTPGIHQASSQLNRLMVKASLSTYNDVDIIGYIILWNIVLLVLSISCRYIALIPSQFII